MKKYNNDFMKNLVVEVKKQYDFVEKNVWNTEIAGYDEARDDYEAYEFDEDFKEFINDFVTAWGDKMVALSFLSSEFCVAFMFALETMDAIEIWK